MNNSIQFRIKPNVDIGKCGILELFFKVWIDDVYNNQVRYGKDISRIWDRDLNIFTEVINVEFVNPEDAVIMRLKGIPEEFRDYMELVH